MEVCSLKLRTSCRTSTIRTSGQTSKRSRCVCQNSRASDSDQGSKSDRSSATLTLQGTIDEHSLKCFHDYQYHFTNKGLVKVTSWHSLNTIPINWSPTPVNLSKLYLIARAEAPHKKVTPKDVGLFNQTYFSGEDPKDNRPLNNFY